MKEHTERWGRGGNKTRTKNKKLKFSKCFSVNVLIQSKEIVVFQGKILPTFIVRMLEVMCDARLYSAWRFIHSRKCEARPSSTRYLRELVAGVSGEEGTHQDTKTILPRKPRQGPTSSPTSLLSFLLCVFTFHHLRRPPPYPPPPPLLFFFTKLSNNKTISSFFFSQEFSKKKKKTLYVISARMSDGGGVIMVRT